MQENVEISIVIPHYNNNLRLKMTLHAVKREVNNAANVEVIVVDNNSAQSPKPVVEGFGFFFLEENRYLNSPYSARNRGIEKASGEVIILLDSACVPQSNWLQNGIECLGKNEADIVSSNIIYEHTSEKPSLSELWDSTFGVNARKSIEKREYAPGGSLFIKRNVFNTLGLFNEGIRSGGDYTFTNTAVKRGYRLMFCEYSVVKYPAKSYADLKAKAIRVGKGQIDVWRSSGRFWLYFVKFLFKPFYPPSPRAVYDAYASAGKSYRLNRSMLVRLFLFGWHLRWLQYYGNLSGLTGLIKLGLCFKK